MPYFPTYTTELEPLEMDGSELWTLASKKKQYISEYRNVSKEHFTSGKEYYAAYTIVIANLLTPLTMNYVTWETSAMEKRLQVEGT